MTRLALAAAMVMAGTTAAYADDLSSADKSFLEKAAQAGHAEVEASKIALTKANAASVKSFADEMVKDHTTVGDKLTALANTKGVKVSDDPSLAQRAKIKMLDTKSGVDFDAQYVKDIGVTAHQDTVALFKKAAANAKDADVKAFAVATLPGLEHHLAEAKTLQTAIPKKDMKTNRKEATNS